jgi:uncharacterized membrane protein
MKKTFTIAFIIVSILTSFGQNYNFPLNWKKGESKTITISNSEREYKNDSYVNDTTIFNEFVINVKNEDTDNYIIEILYQNIAFNYVTEVYDKLSEELPDYENLK